VYLIFPFAPEVLSPCSSTSTDINAFFFILWKYLGHFLRWNFQQFSWVCPFWSHPLHYWMEGFSSCTATIILFSFHFFLFFLFIYCSYGSTCLWGLVCFFSLSTSKYCAWILASSILFGLNSIIFLRIYCNNAPKYSTNMFGILRGTPIWIALFLNSIMNSYTDCPCLCMM